MATGDFDTYYSDNPWSAIDKNQREWYDPMLIDFFRSNAVFTSSVGFAKNLGPVSAKTMTVTGLLDPHPDYTAINLRQLWLPASHIDSQSVQITFSHYAGKVAYQKYDDMITYWKKNGRKGLKKIVYGALGYHMISVFDYLSRNAYVEGALNTGFYMITGGGTDFSDVGSSDKFDINIANDIWLGMSYRNVPSALGADGAAGNLICYTTPGVIYDIQGADDWISTRQYQDLSSALRYEVGTYKNVRFIQTPRATLWNAGAITAQAQIVSAVTAGDGAPDPDSVKVDGTYAVGQTTAGVTNYLQMEVPASWEHGTAWSDFAVNDIVTIHTQRTASYGITDGVDPFEGKAEFRRIVGIDTGNNRITFDRPIMDDFDTDLGSGVYGYVTKGLNVHASIFVGAPNGVVAGVGQPPRLYTPPPVDDLMSVNRFSWDAYVGHQPYRPEVFEVVFSAGSTRVKGDTTV